MPLDDWQFWVVSLVTGAVVLLGAVAIWRGVRSGSKPKKTRVTLTIGRSGDRPS